MTSGLTFPHVILLEDLVAAPRVGAGETHALKHGVAVGLLLRHGEPAGGMPVRPHAVQLGTVLQEVQARVGGIRGARLLRGHRRRRGPSQLRALREAVQ